MVVRVHPGLLAGARSRQAFRPSGVVALADVYSGYRERADQQSSAPVVLALHLGAAEQVVGLGALPARLVVAIERVQKHVEEHIHQGLTFVVGQPPRVDRVARQRQEVRRLATDDLREASVLPRRQRLWRRLHAAFGGECDSDQVSAPVIASNA